MLLMARFTCLAVLCYSIATLFGAGPMGFWLSMLLAPIGVALISLATERGLFCRLYDREHLMLLLFTFALMLLFRDAVKLIWGSEYRSLAPPVIFQGSLAILGMPFPKYNLFLLSIGPIVAFALWFLTQRTKIGKIARAAAVDRDMVGAVGINVSWVFAAVFVIGCFLAGLGGALVAPTQKHYPGHGSHYHHGSLSDRDSWWPGQHMGRAVGGPYLWSHRFNGNTYLASVSNSISLRCCGHSAYLPAKRSA